MPAPNAPHSSVNLSAFILGLVASGITVAVGQDSITIRGSDTLGAELVPQWRDAFVAGGANATFDIAAEGSSAAFSNLLNGTADIGMASRAAKGEEVSNATAAGINLRGTVICYDMICVIIHENNPVTNLSLEQVQDIFSGEITDWAELGGIPGTIAAYTRNTASGTYKAFQSLAMNNQEYAQSTQKMAGNQEIADEVSANESGIGYVGLSYAETDGVMSASIDQIEASPAKAAEYPIARACYFYTNGIPSGTVKQFIRFCLSPSGDEITRDVGFIPTP